MVFKLFLVCFKAVAANRITADTIIDQASLRLTDPTMGLTFLNHAVCVCLIMKPMKTLGLLSLQLLVRSPTCTQKTRALKDEDHLVCFEVFVSLF